jgi:DNA repair protein RadA/Sms
MESAKWQGKCPSCNAWNTFVEELIQKDGKKEIWKDENDKSSSKSLRLSEVSEVESKRIVTKDLELNRVLGGGIVEGSVVLIAGEPGIGKSTLFLQDCLQLQDTITLYISGEESLQQIKMRADRINIQNDRFYLLNATDTQAIFNEIKK